MKHLVLSLCAGVLGCGSADSALSGTLAWKFDYKNWTDDAAVAELRSCGNAPAGGLGSFVPAYPKVAEVRVVLDDPSGEVPGVDEDVPCAQGAGGDEYELRGLSERPFDLTLLAKAADGTVLYRTDDVTLDFAKKVDESFTLRAVTGETEIFARFTGATVGICPAGLTDVRVSFYPFDASINVLAEPAYTRTFDACDDDGFVETLYVRNIPSDPPAGPTGDFLPTQYEGKLEGLNGLGEVIYCSKPAVGDETDVSQPSRFLRSVAPGGPSINNDDVVLDPATSCP